MKNNLVGLLALSLALSSCLKTEDKSTYRIILEDPSKVLENDSLAKSKLSIKLAKGLKIQLWASDSLSPDPVAMDIDDQGAVFINRTNRQKNSEFDIRGYRDWMIPSISFQSVEDRRAFLRKTFAPELSDKNAWVKDLNNDGSHDWKDLAVEKEEIWKLEDKDGDGFADFSARVLNDFNSEITDVAGGVLVRKKDAFVAVGPDLWRLENNNKLGLLTNPKSISTGYAVHIGFGGHGMSGVVEGLDGKIYWQIGDIGANITDLKGNQYKHSNSGVVVRSNPDGSDFEVFSYGNRNTHEFAFDDYGNLISSDNDGDHPGESERLVHIVEGADLGWRSNWQYGKYVDPNNNQYKVWMDEKMAVPRWEGQAAYILPTIKNYHNGPTGMVWNPGTGLGKKWKNKFFLVEFVGEKSHSHIWSFDLKPKGASFDFNSEEDVISGILPTGLRFGPEGALYTADWVFGWNTKNYGRVWKIDVTDPENDLSEIRKKTKEFIQQDYSLQTEESLYELLFFPDQRVRKKAQFELVERGNKGFIFLHKAVLQKENQLARLHGIWGIGQIAAKSTKYAESIVGHLEDKDPEVQAQVAKVLGDIRYTLAEAKLIPLLKSENSRSRFFGAQALGRIKSEKAIEPLINLLAENNDQDNYLRHAAVLALARIGKAEPIIALKSSDSRALRIAAVLVLRRMGNENLREFLKDQDEFIVTEAARAINDDASVLAALPDLAALLNNTGFSNEALLRRSINACWRVGGTENIERLVKYAQNPTSSQNLKAEALAALGNWGKPTILDRVTGEYRGNFNRNPEEAMAVVKPIIPTLLKTDEIGLGEATAKLISDLGIRDFEEIQVAIYQSKADEKIRLAHFKSLIELGSPLLKNIIVGAFKDENSSIKNLALSNIAKVNISKEALPEVVNHIMTNGKTAEKQSIIRGMSTINPEITSDVYADLVNKMTRNEIPKEIRLDLREAVEKINAEKLIAKLDALVNNTNPLEKYMDALYGGDRKEGFNIFNYSSAAECTRCHNLDGRPGGVGPSLKGMGSKLTREQILEALIIPSARLSPGYGTINLKLKDGQEITGILMEEDENEVKIHTSDAAEPLEIAKSRIQSRENYPSAMPPMGEILSKQEIRNLVEFVSGLKY